MHLDPMSARFANRQLCLRLPLLYVATAQELVLLSSAQDKFRDREKHLHVDPWRAVLAVRDEPVLLRLLLLLVGVGGCALRPVCRLLSPAAEQL